MDGQVRGAIRRAVAVGRARLPSANSTAARKAVDSSALVPPSRKSSELTIEALYLTGSTSGSASAGASRGRDHDPRGACAARSADDIPDEGERARMISELTRLIREPQMPESTRCAGLTLIGWLARRMPGEPAHAIGVAEARQSEHRIRATSRKSR